MKLHAQMVVAVEDAHPRVVGVPPGGPTVSDVFREEYSRSGRALGSVEKWRPLIGVQILVAPGDVVIRFMAAWQEAGPAVFLPDIIELKHNPQKPRVYSALDEVIAKHRLRRRSAMVQIQRMSLS